MKQFIKTCFISLIFIMICSIPSYANSSNPNVPVLASGMTPVKWDDKNEYTTQATDVYWYDYDNNKWANAKDDNGNYWVWIPRYTYKIDNNKVLIKWSKGIVDDVSDGYMTHPAFVSEIYKGGNPNQSSSYEDVLDSNKLTGFWIGKNLIKNGTQIDTSKNINEAFESCLEMSNLDGVVTHLTKASEWGAVAYLTNAKGVEPDQTKNTTGNYYGVNNMVGYPGEYVAAYINNGSSTLAGAERLIDKQNARFVDVIELTATDTVDNNKTVLSKFYGFAMTETEGFGSSNIDIPTGMDPFFTRGGEGTGFYGYGKNNGIGLGYRPVMSVYSSYLSDEISFFDTEASVVAGDYLVISVNFRVDKDWKFGLNSGETIISNGKVIAGKEKRIFDFIDLRYVQDNGVISFSKDNLNEELIGIIKDSTTLETLNEDTILEAGSQYTLRVRVGGYNQNNEPIFNTIPGMTSKIIINSINVQDKYGEPLRVSSIVNNKVRLTIYGSNASVPILTGVKLVSAPDKTEYYLNEKLSLTGGKIELSYGDNKAIVDITKDNVINYNNATSNIGQKQIELIYEGKSVLQDDVQFIINVNNNSLFNVTGKVNPINTASIVKGIGQYEKGETVTLSANIYPGYKFTGWSSDGITITNSTSSSNATFTMPQRDVLVTATTMKPTKIEVVNPKTEFEINSPFELGEEGYINVYYPDGTIEKIEDLTQPGITSDPINNEILDELGEKDVVIKYADQEITYKIEVVKTKYEMTISIDSKDYGVIKKDGEIVVPNGEETTAKLKISYDSEITLGVEPKTGFVFDGWYISESNIIPNENLRDTEIKFVMPQKDIKITANFVGSYTIEYVENDSNYGKIEGQKVQSIKYGGNASKVTAVANDGYMFKRWKEDGRLNAVREDQNITKSNTYTAEFVKGYTVKYMNDGTLFMEKVIEEGTSGYIPDIPKKNGYVFYGWDKDLSKITQDTVTNAKFLPRLEITPNGSQTPIDCITSHITGRGIKEGSLEYIITNSPTEVVLDSSKSLTFAGNWSSQSTEPYKTYIKNNRTDKDNYIYPTIIINSEKTSEIVRFDYMFNTSFPDNLRSVTVNGARVSNDDDGINMWNKFYREVNVVNGKIVIGISYNPEKEYDANDFVAIKGLTVGNSWTTITNEHDLNDGTIWNNNYVHIRGVGSDDNVTYKIVSEVFKGSESSSESDKIYNITYELDGGTVNPENPTEYTPRDEITLKNPTKYANNFLGWTGSNGDAYETLVKILKGSTGNKHYIANWIRVPYTITLISDEGATIEGVYENHKCAICGGYDHECGLINIYINPQNAVIE